MAIENATTQALEAWKRQFDVALRLVEAMTEGAAKIHETQLEAATDAHANAVATQKSAAGVADPVELARIQSQWALHNMEHVAAYWRALFEAALETNSTMIKCLCEQPGLTGLPTQSIDIDASKGALLGMVDNAYKQWLDASRRFYAAPAELLAAASKSGEQGAAAAR